LRLVIKIQGALFFVLHSHDEVTTGLKIAKRIQGEKRQLLVFVEQGMPFSDSPNGISTVGVVTGGDPTLSSPQRCNRPG
jgi:hypothetical protein